jgi:hypothetical protein
MTRARLGVWQTPHGNACDVFLVGDGPARDVVIEWDRYPLSAADEQHYTVAILPAITQRAREYLELPRAATVRML